VWFYIIVMNDWNEKIEKTIYNLGAKCGAYRIMHDEASDYCSRIDTWYSIISISLSTLTATGIISLEDTATVKIISGVTIYFIAFISSIKEFLNYTKMSENHKLYSMKFSALYRNIHSQLCIEKNKRQNGIEFLLFVNTELDNMLFSNPHIPEGIKKKRLGGYDKNSAHEISMSKDIYDVILNIDCKPGDIDLSLQEEKDISLESTNTRIKDNRFINYQIDKFMSHN
jgi:hypothetical protein